MKDTAALLIRTIILVGVMAGLVFVFGGKYLKHRAIETCILAGYEDYRNAEAGSGTRVPSWDTYRVCMQEKGYSTAIKAK